MKDVHEEERYAPIEGFPNYLVTSHGRVLSLKDNHGNDRVKELKPQKFRIGYMYVNLYKNGKMNSKTVHRLVAQAFIPNPENKTEVNHIDEDKTNNQVSNLEWMSAKENRNHGTRNERAGKAISKTNGDGRRKGINNPRARAVVGFKINGCGIKYYKYIRECEKDGFDQPAITKCCKGKYKSHKGYIWFYADEFFNRKDDDNL